ncbi:diguanylate cyclase domain-containing protein, partial [Mangrovactinospora gilvigrisea]|uniref:diguanylate cyclase domain-containing protein n=1 Tax=Mangrovactinospora gilvigrisea TaxID=1428644 RepID=UPI000A75075F
PAPRARSSRPARPSSGTPPAPHHPAAPERLAPSPQQSPQPSPPQPRPPSGPRRRPRRAAGLPGRARRALAAWQRIAVVLLIAGCLAGGRLAFPAANDRLDADDLAIAAAAALAAAVCLRSALRNRGRPRAGWLLLAVSQVLLGAGLGVRQLTLPTAPHATFGNLAAHLLALALPFVLGALLLLADRPPGGLWVCRVLDAWITTGALVALAWSLALMRAGAAGGTQANLLAIAHVYPVLETVGIAVAIGIRVRAHGRNGSLFINICLVAVALMAVGDGLLDPHPGYAAALRAGELTHVGQLAATAALACVPWIDRWSARPRWRAGLGVPIAARAVRLLGGVEGRPGAVCSALTPYVAAAICVVALAWPIAEGGGPDGVTLACCGSVLLALLVRQGVTLLQNIRLTRELAEQESHFRSLVQGSSDVIMIAGRDEALRYVSPAARRVFGRPAEALAGARLGDLIHPEDRGRVLRAVRGLLDGAAGAEPVEASADPLGEPARVEYRVRSGTGSWLHVESVADRHPDGLILSCRDVTDRVRLQAQLQHNAFHDPLTDLPNRTLFAERTRQALANRRAAVGGYDDYRATAVLYIDLDGFKSVNDASGHDAGDELLTQVARRLETSVRSCDTVARLGG